MRQRSSIRWAVWALCAANLALTPLARPQGLTGQISGSLGDPAGKAVEGAIVVLTNAGTGQIRKTATNQAGDFVFVELLPGVFDLETTMPGFKRFEQKGIILTASDRVVLNPIALQIGDVSETMEVQAANAQVRTESAERSGLVDAHQLAELSLKGRDYMATLQLSPGVLDVNSTSREAPGSSTLQGIYFNGNRQGSLSLTLDGIFCMDTGGGTGPYFEPSIDAVAEVKVLLTAYQAEYGRSSGGTINTVTKSGTKDFSAGAYYYFRNEDLNANEFFNNRQGIARPLYRYNYPGYFVGGPVVIPGTNFNRNRDKLFFFWSQEFLERASPTSVTFQTFPTALERTGDFSQSLDQNGKLIPIRDPLTNAVFPGNMVPTSRIDRNGQILLNVFPLPNTVDPTHTYDYAFQSDILQPRRDKVLRVDWNISPKTQFYARGIQDYEAKKGGFGFTLASPSWPQLPVDIEFHSVGFVSTLIHTFTPTQVNELTFGISRGNQAVQPPTPAALAENSRSALHLTMGQFYPQANPLNLIPNATFGSVPDAPQLNIDQRYPYFGPDTIWDYMDNFSQTTGQHSMKFGVYIEHSSTNKQLSTFFNGAIAFDRDSNNPLDTGYAFSNALLGSIDNYTESSQHPVGRARDNNVEWYAQDSWKATRRLTIEAGVRFYWLAPTISAGTKLATFDPATYQAAQQPPLIQPYLSNGVRMGIDPVTGTLYPAVYIGTFSNAAGTPNQGMKVFNESVLQTPPIQVAPRVGLAWDVFGNGRTAIRTGFGIYPDRFADNQVLQLVQSPPLVQTPTAYYTTLASLATTKPVSSPASVYGIQTNWKPPTVYNWTFDVQQSLDARTALDVAYVGDVGRHEMQIRDLNATNYGTNFLAGSIDPTVAGNKPLPANFLRPIQGYSDIQYMEFASNSNYHALQVQLTRRFSAHFNASASYTWSKVLDVADTVSSPVNPYLNYRSRNYGPASFDRRQNFKINYVYSLPSFGKHWNNSKFAHQALDGWEISGISAFISGAPTAIAYTFVTAADVTGAAGIGIDTRVNLTCNPNQPLGTAVLNGSCLQPPTKAGLGIGNASKYPVVGPGVENFDVSLFKNFKLGASEARRLQFRLETFNTFNHSQYTAVDTNARFDASGNQVNQDFGQYTAAAPARRLALGLKLYF